MKKGILFLFVVLTTLVFISCSDDDDEKINLSQSDVTGFWNVTEYATTGKYQNIAVGNIYIQVNSDNTYKVKFLTNTYIGKYTIDGNTMVGITLDPITEYFRFDKLQNNNAEISYSNSEGQKYKFKASK